VQILTHLESAKEREKAGIKVGDDNTLRGALLLKAVMESAKPPPVQLVRDQ
jgi:hypothetical protein